MHRRIELRLHAETAMKGSPQLHLIFPDLFFSPLFISDDFFWLSCPDMGQGQPPAGILVFVRYFLDVSCAAGTRKLAQKLKRPICDISVQRWITVDELIWRFRFI